MSNLAYLRYRDRRQGTISVSSEDAVYPKANLDTLPVANPLRTGLGQVAAQWIEYDFGAAASIDVVGVVAHNLSATATMQLNAGAAPAPDGSTFNVAIAPRERTAWRKFAQQSYRYWRLAINDPQNPDGFLSIGLLLPGLATTLQAGFNHEDYSYQDDSALRENESEIGVPHTGPTLYDLARMSIAFSNVDRAQQQELRAWLVGLHGRREPLLIIPSPEHYDDALFGRLSTPVRRTGRGNTGFHWDIGTVEFVEDHPGEAIREPLFVAEGDLNEWDAGDSLGAFTRSSAARYKDVTLALQAVTAHQPRQLHYLEAGKAGLLLESAGQNDFLYSEEIDNAYWTTVGIDSVTPDAIAAPHGSMSADKLVEDTSNGTHELVKALPGTLMDNTLQAFSFFAKAGERTSLRVILVPKSGTFTYATVDLTDGSFVINSGGIKIKTEDYGNDWWRILCNFDVESGGTGPQVELRIEDSGGNESYTGDGASGLYLWGMQFEGNRPWPSSYMASSLVNGTRAAELATLTATFAPQPVTMYARWVDLGQVDTGADGEVAVALMGDVGGTHVAIRQAATLRAYHDNGVSAVNSAIANAGGHGDIVEALAIIDGAGAVTIKRKVNGGAETAGSASGNLALPANWGAPGPLRFGVEVAGAAAPLLLQRVALGRGALDWGDLDS